VIKKIIVISIVTLMVGCAPFAPQPGMTYQQVSRAAYVPCPGSMKVDDQHLVFVGNLSDDPSIKIYRTAAFEKFRQGSGPCAKNLYFKDGILLSDERIKQIRDENIAKQQLKIAEMKKYIDANRLIVLDRFQSTSDSDFKIYTNSAKQYFYSINYAFVDKSTVLPQIKIYEENARRDADLKAKAAQAQKEEAARKEQQQNQQKLNQF